MDRYCREFKRRPHPGWPSPSSKPDAPAVRFRRRASIVHPALNNPSDPASDLVRQVEKLPLQRFLEGLLSLPLPRLNLTEYRAIVGQLPPPSHDQIEAFADYVSAAKSWYKHLPLWPPGEPFLFYIDPHVGLDCIVDASGGATYLPRTEETPPSHRFHYTWMTTEEYRSRYGWLAFSSNAGTQLMIPVTAP
jgi:hypothetical protein